MIMTKIIAFDSEKDGESFLKSLWVAYLKKRAVEEETFFRTPEKDVVTSIEGMSDDAISKLVILGKKPDETVVLSGGETTAYEMLIKADGIEKWYVKEPPEEIMDTAAYAKIDLPEEWLSPVEKL